MSILSDSKILAKIYSKEFNITPCQLDNIQASSIDLTLGESIEVPKNSLTISPPYPSRDEIRNFYDKEVISQDYILAPGKFILGQIQETIELSDKLVGNIQNRNSLIRLGINVGLSSYINPGYKGKLPVTIHNIGTFDFKLTPGMRICQLVLTETSGVVLDYSRREDAKYHAETEITLSKLSEDKEFTEYVQRYGKNTDTGQLKKFLQERVTEKTQNFFAQLTSEQRKGLGLS